MSDSVPAYGELIADLTDCVLTPTGASGRVYLADAIASGSVTIPNLTAAILNLPTSLPANSGVLWINGGVIQLS